MKQIFNISIMRIVGYVVTQITLLALVAVLIGVSVVVMDRTVGFYTVFYVGDINLLFAAIFWTSMLFGGFVLSTSASKNTLSFWHEHFAESWVMYCLVVLGAVPTIKTYALMISAYLQDPFSDSQIHNLISLDQYFIAYIVSVSILAIIVNILALRFVSRKSSKQKIVY